jgi:hypothetical protein
MKRSAWFAASVAALSACAGSGGGQEKTPETRDLAPVFAAWKTAWVEGNFDGVYKLTSVTFRSRWVYEMFIPVSDRNGGVTYGKEAAEAYKKIPADIAADFESWMRTNRINDNIAFIPPPLPTHIMKSEWLKQTLRADFAVRLPTVKHIFAGLEYREAFLDGDVVSLVVRNIRNESEIYELVKEEDEWRFNYWKPSPPKR